MKKIETSTTLSTATKPRSFFIFIIIIFLLSIALIYLFYTYFSLKTSYAKIESDLASTKDTSTRALSDKDTQIETLNKTIDELKQSYALSEENGTTLLSELDAEKARNGEFAKKITKISSTVGRLDKLSKIDPKLLQKYSKIYFLNEHFAPEKLSNIPSSFLLEGSTPKEIDAKVAPFLTRLLTAAQNDNIDIRVTSAYRSFESQKSLKSAYTVQYGSGANTFSADQGYSEHQLGTTVDFTTPSIGGGLDGFENSDAYAWLEKNAYKYGFVLSYPKGNAYYIFEPWHWRFVGEDLADDLHTTHKNFYDMDQHKIDTYLISLFD